MNQHVLFHFSFILKDKSFQLIIEPGTQWDVIEEALEKFKQELETLKKETIAREAAKAQEGA